MRTESTQTAYKIGPKSASQKEACFNGQRFSPLREFPPLASGVLANATCAAEGLMLTNIIILGSKHFFTNEYEDSVGWGGGGGGWGQI